MNRATVTINLDIRDEKGRPTKSVSPQTVTSMNGLTESKVMIIENNRQYHLGTLQLQAKPRNEKPYWYHARMEEVKQNVWRIGAVRAFVMFWSVCATNFLCVFFKLNILPRNRMRLESL